MIRRIRIWRIVMAVVAFPILASIGVVTIQGLQNRTFTPQTLQQRTIDQRKIEQKKLTPARNLVGDWQGNGKYIFHQTDVSYCDMNFQIDLKITSQKDNKIGGNVTVTWLNAAQHGNFACAQVPTTNDPVNGTVTGSRLTINAGNGGNFTGSFTTDTITLNQPKDANGDGLVGSIKLLRQ